MSIYRRNTTGFKNVAPRNDKKYSPKDLHSSRAIINKEIIKESVTERRDRVVNTPALYSGGHGFKSRPGDRLS
jgi:hypothetical protein